MVELAVLEEHFVVGEVLSAQAVFEAAEKPVALFWMLLKAAQLQTAARASVLRCDVVRVHDAATVSALKENASAEKMQRSLAHAVFLGAVSWRDHEPFAVGVAFQKWQIPCTCVT